MFSQDCAEQLWFNMFVVDAPGGVLNAPMWMTNNYIKFNQPPPPHPI